MKTLTYDGEKYKIVFATEMEVVVDLHKEDVFGHISRWSIPIESLSPITLSRLKKSRVWKKRVKYPSES